MQKEIFIKQPQTTICHKNNLLWREEFWKTEKAMKLINDLVWLKILFLAKFYLINLWLNFGGVTLKLQEDRFKARCEEFQHEIAGLKEMLTEAKNRRKTALKAQVDAEAE